MRLLDKFPRVPFRRNRVLQARKMVAVSAETHREAALAAIALGENLNTFLETAIRERLQRLRQQAKP